MTKTILPRKSTESLLSCVLGIHRGQHILTNHVDALVSMVLRLELVVSSVEETRDSHRLWDFKSDHIRNPGFRELNQ